MDGLHDLVAALCRLPITYHERDVSEVDLIREIGYADHATEITDGLIEEHIRAHPELLEIWVHYSEDQRCSPAWVLSGRDTVGDPTKDWHVSYWDHDLRRGPTRYFLTSSPHARSSSSGKLTP